MLSTVAPLNLFDANVRGCGKSLLTDATSQIVAGREMARMSLPRDDEEFRKRITALAVAGEPLILIDNIAGTLGSASLDAALTATSWSDRILGLTAMASNVPLFATWYATGNNVVLAADTARRTAYPLGIAGGKPGRTIRLSASRFAQVGPRRASAVGDGRRHDSGRLLRRWPAEHEAKAVGIV